MDQKEIQNTDAKLNESVAKVNELSDKVDDSLSKMIDSNQKVHQSSDRFERAIAVKPSPFGGYFWLLMTIIAAIVVLYFIPSSGIKPYVDRSGEKLGQAGSKVSDKIASAVDHAQSPHKAPNATTTEAPLNAKPTAPILAKPPVTSAQQAAAADSTAQASTAAAVVPAQTKPAEKVALATTATTPASTVDSGKSSANVAPSPAVAQTDATDPSKNMASAARIAARDYQYGLAINLYETHLDANPDDADAWGELGNVQLLVGRPYEAAQNYYEASIRQIDQGRLGTVYPLLPIIKHYQPRLAAILHQKMAMMGL
jgi:hypothetical protein